MVILDALVIGDCGIHSAPDQHGVVEIGYGLASSYHSKGIGTTVVRMISDYLGSLPEVTKVIAQTEPGNLPSQRVLTKNGFHKVESEGDLLRFERAATP